MWGSSFASVLGTLNRDPTVWWSPRLSGIGELCYWQALIVVRKPSRDREARSSHGIFVRARGALAEWLVNRNLAAGCPIHVQGSLDVRRTQKYGFQPYIMAREATDLTESGVTFRRGRVSVPVDEYRRLKAIEEAHPETVIPEGVLKQFLSERDHVTSVGYDSFRLPVADEDEPDE